MQLYLIRHPPPEVAAGICYGRTDLALATDVGAVAMEIARRLPPGIPVFSSPLRRCRELAMALDPAPRIDARLVEMDFGEWEMTPWEGIQRTALEGWAADPLGYRPPGGESVGELRARVRDFIAAARREGIARAALVTHAGVMKTLVGEVRALPERQWMALSFDYAGVVRIELPG